MVSRLGYAVAEGEEKGRALIHGTLGPDPPAVTVDDALHGREAHACPFILRRVV
jgi:hypothetical protein